MGKAEQRQRDKARALANADERRRVVLRVYEGCEQAAAARLAQLAARGVTASCAAGCTFCCSYEIPTTRAEAETLVAWLQEHRSAAELAAIGDRLRGWLAWYRDELPRVDLPRDVAFARHAPRCALLEADGRCGAYPVRPVSCRNHLVSSPAADCDPASGKEPVQILDVPRATVDHVSAIRRTIERQGGNFLASVH
ncbi:MAG: YkgJ family cysteine cluster protein, partial [Acidobacteriota bacterium]